MALFKSYPRPHGVTLWGMCSLQKTKAFYNSTIISGHCKHCISENASSVGGISNKEAEVVLGAEHKHNWKRWWWSKPYLHKHLK